MKPILVIADDLSGAAEAATAIGILGTKIWTSSDPRDLILEELKSANHVVIDINDRGLDSGFARKQSITLEQLIQDHVEHRLVFRKADSLLRGHLDVMVASASTFGPIVMSMANPSANRTVVNGAVRVLGSDISSTGLWDTEKNDPWQSIQDAIAPTKGQVVPLEIIRGPKHMLLDHLEDITSRGLAAICDAETDVDLETVAATALQLERVQLIGSAGLARAVGKYIGSNEAPEAIVPFGSTNTMIIVGSASQASLDQVAALEKSGHAILDARSLSLEQVESTISEFGNVVLHPIGPQLLSEDLRELVRGCSIIATGGATARAILDFLNAHWIIPYHEVETGLVACQTSQGQIMVIKPGSYGDDETLLRALEFLTTTKPRQLGIQDARQ
jgi:uncharacterized protein YgbK (DUF1537 family)